MRARPLDFAPLDFISKVRKNMKPVQHTLFDRALLKRRSLIENVVDELKLALF